MIKDKLTKYETENTFLIERRDQTQDRCVKLRVNPEETILFSMVGESEDCKQQA